MTETTETETVERAGVDKVERLCTLIPLGGQIIIKRDPPKLKTKGGILLPTAQNTAKQVRTGVVIRKGTGYIVPGTAQRVEISHLIQPGARVMFMQHAGGDYPHEEAHGEEVYLLMQEAEIVCLRGTYEDGVPIPECVVSQEELSEAIKAEQGETLKIINAARKSTEAQAVRVANTIQGRSPGGIHRPR